MTHKRFIPYVWLTLIVTLLVILWGDVVQATGSGDGCGAHWPVCNGEVLPEFAAQKTLIEYAHRATSGLVFLMAVGLLFWARRSYAKGSPVRKSANFFMLFMITESLVGAGLVLFRLVGTNASLARAMVAPIHLINTLLLVGSVTLCLYFAMGGKAFRWKAQGSTAWFLGIGIAAIIFLAVTGAVTSLGDAIFPVRNTTEALERSMTAGEHFLVRLRIYHPFIAIIVGLYVILAARFISQRRPTASLKNLSLALFAVYLLQLAVGTLNVALSAILPTQLIHLLLADSIWILWVLFTANALSLVPSPAKNNAKVSSPQISGTD